jgi:suppressor for copper-sensitivity B
MLCAVRSWLALVCAVTAAVALQEPARGAASPWSDHGTVAVRLVAGAPAGEELRLGLHFRLAPGWHVYWKHPGDAGASPEVAVAPETGSAVRAPRLLFPAPTRFRLPGGLEALGYEGEVVYPLRVAGPAPARLSVAVDYVACAIECIPYHDELELASPAVPSRDAEEALLRTWEERLPLSPVAARVTPAATYEIEPEPTLELTLAGLPAAASAPELFLEPSPGASFGAAETRVEGTTVSFRVPVRADVADQPPNALRVAWTVTGLPTTAGPRAVAAVAEVAARGPGARAVRPLDSPPGPTAPPRGWFSALLLGVLLAFNPAGLAVLLLPLVRPVASSDPASSHALWRLPALAALGMAVALAALGLAGRTGGIAAPLAEPALLAALALPPLALALALWLAPPSRLPATALASGAAFLALPWLPLGGWTAMPPMATAGALAVGFMVPFAVVSSLPVRARIASPVAPRTLGFVAAGALVWSALRLGAILPTAEVAGVEIAWLAVALCVREASAASATRRVAWLLAALAAGATGVWLANTPAIL